MSTCHPDRFNSGVLFHRIFAVISTFFSRIIMAPRRFDSFKRIIDRIHNWATPQPKNTSSNENSSQNSNISGNSTTRPPEGEEHEMTSATKAAETPQSHNGTKKTQSTCNEAQLAEVVVMPVNDTKMNTATRTTKPMEAATIEVVAVKANTNTADIDDGNGSNQCLIGGAKNSCASNVMEANEATNTERNNSAIAPIAREEDDTEVVSEEEEEEEIKDMEYCCYSINNNEQRCQSDEQAHVKQIATATNTSTLAVTVTLTSKTTTAEVEEKSAQRSTSRVRTYLKKCKYRLTGHHHQQQQLSTNTQTPHESSDTYVMSKTEIMPITMHLQDEKSKEFLHINADDDDMLKEASPKRDTNQRSALAEGEENEKACTTALITATLQQDQYATQKLLTTFNEKCDNDVEHSTEEAEDEETDDTLTEVVYEDIDFSLTSTLMDNSSVSNVSVDQHQSTSLTSECERRNVDDQDTLGLLAIEVDDSGDLVVESETRIQQQIQSEGGQHIKLDLWAKKSEEDEETEGKNAAETETLKLQQQQLLKANVNSCLPLVKEEQLACAIRMDSGTAALIDKHLGTIYPIYSACTRAILIRQARDLLVCSYFGCLQSFEMQFLCKFAQIAAELRQRHAIGENVLWNKGWPLTTPTGEIILHLGALENAFVRPGDIYLCVKSVTKTEAPELYVSWRNPSSAIPTEQNLPHASVTTHLITSEPTKAKSNQIQNICIDLNNATTQTSLNSTLILPTYLSILTLEMLTSDELPQLLQHLLVGVEHSIERVSLNDLQMPNTTTTMTTATTNILPLAADDTNNNSNVGIRSRNNNNNNNHITNNSSITNSNSPKCALRRSELITKNKVLNNKFMLRRLTNRQDSMNSTSSGQSCGSSGSTSSDELLRCNSKTMLSNNGGGAGVLFETFKMSPAGSTNSASTSPALPLFCMGNTFPHIDSDEENADEKRSDAHREDQYECEIVPPASISEIPEKLLTTSGIYLPGTRDLKGNPLVTVDAECVLAAGLNCYEIATVLLYYSTLSERISTENANDPTTQYQQQQQQMPSMEQQSQQTSISSPSVPKMANAALTKTTTTSTTTASTAATTTVQFAISDNTATIPLTSKATAVKLPAHTNTTAIATTTTADNNTNDGNSNNKSIVATPAFTILIAIEKSIQMCVIDLICQSLRLLTRQIAYCEILAICFERDFLQQQQQQHVATFHNATIGNSENNESNKKEQQQQPKQQQKQHQQYSLKFISANEVTTSVAPSSQIPYGKLQGLHHHDARKWREFFLALDPFHRQCATAGQRLVAAMSDIRSADLQGLPTRRQLYAQHRALSRALMDSELHNLRKRGALQLARLQELAKSYAATMVTAPAAAAVTNMPTNGSENSHGNHNGNSNANNSCNNNSSSNRYYYNSNSSGCNNSNSNRYSSSGNKLLSTISSISHLGFGGSYSFSMHHSQQQQHQLQQSQITQSQNCPIVSKYNAMMTSCDRNGDTIAVAANSMEGGDATDIIGHNNMGNMDIAIRLYKVTLLFNEVDRAAKRLEQLTEQRREQLRELTRQRALEDEINEVTSWISSDGNDMLQRYASLQFDCETAIKEQEHEFEKYYFISMKHIAKGRDLHNAAVNIEALHESAVNLKSALDCFSEKLEMARERIEAASRLQHLLAAHNTEAHMQQEMHRLAEVAGATVLLEKYRQSQQQLSARTTETTEQSEPTEVRNISSTNNTSNKPNSLNLSFNLNQTYRSSNSNNLLKQQLQHVAVITSTPVPRMNRLSHRSSSGIGSFDGQSQCQCWRESRNMEDMDEMLDADGEELECEDGEEEQSKIADSGVGGCERCEGNHKLTRVCSCQSLNEAANLYGKSDELDFECFERPVKRYPDLHSPMEANAHLQYHASSLELSKLEELSCLDPKIQKTLLLIMREMIGTERDYVHSLNYVIENYVDELAREDIPQPLRGQRNVIFGNIEKIFEFHKWHFLNELERHERNPLKVGSAFLEMESKFYLYALYNKNKPKSDTLMSEYGTAFFKSKQFELNDKMDLASYLLKPVQRMGKYALLLQQLVKACNSVEGAALQEIAADVEELQRAEEMVKFQLRHGNDLLAMDSLRDCDVNVKEQGRLLRQNEFLVWQGRGGKKSLRQIFLFEDLVLFSKARRFPDQKNLDIYIYKNSIKTSDIGLTAHVGDSKTKFEIWFRKRKPDDTWTLQCMSEDIKNAWTEEISKLLWKQANRNREIRLAEMSSMGIGSKPCLDIRPSHNQINDRSITISQLGKAPKLRHSFAGMHLDGTKNARRPNSLISESSLSSGTSSSSLSTGSSSGHERLSGGQCSSKTAMGTINSHHALELINETQTLMLTSGSSTSGLASGATSSANTNTLSSTSSSGRSGHSSSKGGDVMGVRETTSGTTMTSRSKRSTTLVSQLSMESGILSDISMTPDQEQSDAMACSNWLNSANMTTTATSPGTNQSSPSAISTTATIGNDSTVIMRRQRYHRHSNNTNNKQHEHNKHKELQHQQSAPGPCKNASIV